MRILGDIPHPRFKITVFQTETRLPVQFEDRELVQIYRLRKEAGYDSLQAVQQWLTVARRQQIERLFHQMRQAIWLDKNDGDLRKSTPKNTDTDLPDII